MVGITLLMFTHPNRNSISSCWDPGIPKIMQPISFYILHILKWDVPNISYNHVRNRENIRLAHIRPTKILQQDPDFYSYITTIAKFDYQLHTIIAPGCFLLIMC